MTLQFLPLIVVVVGMASCCTLPGPLDLGRGLDAETLHWGTSRGFEPGELLTFDLPTGVQYAINEFCSGEHTGTHLDAPFHFNDIGWTVGQIPLDRLIANGVFLNVSAEAAGNPDFLLQPRHLAAWEEMNGPLPERTVLLVSFGWAQRYADRKLYFGTETNDTTLYRFPGLSAEMAKALLATNKVVGVGVDTASIDPPNKYTAHSILAKGNVFNLENVDLEQPCLPARGFKLYALPMKITNGTGAPVRIIAMPESNSQDSKAF